MTVLKSKDIQGMVVEHWIDRRLRLHIPIALEGNIPRVSAMTMVKLNDLKNKLMGTNYSLFEASKLAGETE